MGNEANSNGKWPTTIHPCGWFAQNTPKHSVEITLHSQYSSIMSDDGESNPEPGNDQITIRVKDQVRRTQATVLNWRLRSDLVAIGAALHHRTRSLRILAYAMILTMIAAFFSSCLF
jgi:small ubiquitin-related modifier